MRILMVNKFLYPNGGSETYIFKLGEQLEKKGNEVQYFGMEHEERIVGNHAECYTTNMDFHAGKIRKLLYPLQILFSFEAKRKMLTVLRDFDPKIVHLNNFNFQLTPSIFYAVRKYAKQKKRHIPIIYTAHDYQWVCPNHMMKIPSTGQVCFACEGGRFSKCSKYKCIHNFRIRSILGSIEGYLYKMLGTYDMTDRIICPSNFMKDKLSTNPVFANKAITLYNFIESKATDMTGENCDLIEMLPQEVVEQGYIIYFGRYTEEKGVCTLLEACKKLPHIYFVFAGKGELEKEVQEVTNVFNMGFQEVKRLRILIQNAGFSIFPSEWYENGPFSVMESQMYGTPVLASRIGGTVELIEEGRCGEFFKPGDVDELCARIENMWKHKKQLKEYQKRCLEVKFDTLEQYTDKLLKIYYDSLNRK